MTRGKKYTEAAKKLAEKESYTIAEALKLLKETGNTKFDSTAEIHINLNIDPTKAEQAIRGTISLPHGSGKKVRIAAIVSDDKIKDAKAAGADEAGLEDLVAEFGKGKINYDVIVATPDVMKKLGKVAKILGQKGIMPNPKAGTVTDDIVKTIKELKAGRLEYRNDKEGNIHSIFGKLSFKDEELENNLRSFIKVIREAKPSVLKGSFVKSITLTSTM
ncbi:MAG TPA: 50S ribosomal protein L1, partial [Thermodesulforhabdus norvegica]|nr:50S ribosomal protein L1 [Thermodesulforhabdus norvegica]